MNKQLFLEYAEDEHLEVRKSNKSWAELGVNVVNGKINGRLSRQKVYMKFTMESILQLQATTS